MNVVVFSSIPWGFLWQRHQQIVSRLAKDGFRILYFQNPIYMNPTELLRNYKEKNIFLAKDISKRLRVTNLFLLDFRGRLRSLAEWPGRLAFNLYLKVSQFKPDIAIFYSVQFAFLASHLSARGVKIVYDCVDEVSAFSDQSKSGSTLLKTEEGLIRKSSLIIASATALCEKIAKLRSDCFYVPNASDFEHFNKATKILERPADIETLNRPIVGFIGAVFDWIDVDLLCKIAQSHPDYSVLLVGPVNSGLDKLKRFPNIVMVGAKDYQILPNYLAFMDVCLVPFKINKLTVASNPIKIYEYLAAGKPVVSTALPELQKSASRVVLVGKDHDDFIQKVELTIEQAKGPDGRSALTDRIEFARDNSWGKRVELIEKLLRNLMAIEKSE